jgi:hypothetical protein
MLNHEVFCKSISNSVLSMKREADGRADYQRSDPHRYCGIFAKQADQAIEKKGENCVNFCSGDSFLN